MQLAITESRESVSEEQIAAVERQLGSSLPRDYRDFLLAHNGGRVRPAVFSVHGNPHFGSKCVVHFFNAIDPGKSHDLLWKAEIYRNRMPLGFLSVASDPGGNQICLVLSGSNIGKVVFWDHHCEEMDEDMPPSEDNVYLIANSFTEFLESLTDG